MATAAPKPLKLPAKAHRLYAFLKGKGDVDILDIHAHLFSDVAELRVAQQRLGPPIVRLNRRLREHKLVVVPGRLKGTYCLTSL